MVRRKILVIKVSLLGSGVYSLMKRRVYRVVEVPADITLRSFAEGITSLFNFDFDHLFGFYDNNDLQKATVEFVPLSNFEFDIEFEYKESYDVEYYTVEELFEKVGSTTAYFLYDFGDRWWFKIELLSEKNIDTELRSIFNVVESRGTPPPQYLSVNDEKDEELVGKLEVIDLLEGEERDHEARKNNMNQFDELLYRFFERELGVSKKLISDVFDRLIEAANNVLFGVAVIDIESIGVATGVIIDEMISRYPNDRKVIDFAIDVIDGWTNWAFNTLGADLFFPIFKLLNKMIELRYPPEKIIEISQYILQVNDKADVKNIANVFKFFFSESKIPIKEPLVALLYLIGTQNKTLKQVEDKERLFNNIFSARIDEKVKRVLAFVIVFSALLTDTMKYEMAPVFFDNSFL
ncbi:MAG: IS1096 element passenger TnpR family protein [Candidatus Asgardarchaeia archaeon]